ncbi:MAG: hypothetical protein CMP19_10415 [Rickettsiales bacterium]|nr:hypothetical protein [Rickettsiales bacterium]
MANNKKAFLGVGGKPRFSQPDQQKHIDSVSKNIAILTGQTKNTKDRAVLVRDLMDFGLLDSRGRFTGGGGTTIVGGNNSGGIVNPDPETPTKPVNVRASAAFTTIMVQWDFPNYAGHEHAEIWRNTIDALGDMTDPREEGEAVLVATVAGSMYMDNVLPETGYYYWVRFVNTEGVTGPVHSASGVYAKTLPDIDTIIEEFQSESLATLESFQETFNGQIDRLDEQIEDFGFEASKLAINQLNSDVLTLTDGLFNHIVTTERNYNDWLADARALGDRADVTEAKLEQEYYTIEDADLAIANAITSFESVVIREDFATIAQLEQNHYTKSDADSAIAAEIQAFRTTYIDPNFVTDSLLTQNYYTKSDADSAIAAGIQTFQSGYLANNYKSNAQLNAAFYTKSAADEAISQAITTLETETLSPNYTTFSYLSTNFYTKTSTDSAIAAKVEEFKAEIVDAEGNITNAFTNKMGEVLTGPDGAIAQEIAEYGVTYGGNTYTIAEGIQVSIDINGEYIKQWGVQSEIGDLQHGVGFIDDNGKTTFLVSVDNFAVFNPVEGDWEAIFGVTDGRVVIKEAVVGDAFLNTLAVQFSAIFENEVLVNGELTAWKLKGAQITGNALWMVNGNHSLAIEPDDFLAFWYGEATYYNVETDTDLRALGNAKFALTNDGRAIARGMELYDYDNNLIMSANGLDGTFIKDLSVGTLAIANNAVTVQSFSESASIYLGKKSTVTIDSATHPHDGQFINGSILMYAIVELYRTTDGDPDNKVVLTLSVLDADDYSVIDAQTITVGHAYNINTSFFSPMQIFSSAVAAQDVVIRLSARSLGEAFNVKMRVVVDSAKR